MMQMQLSAPVAGASREPWSLAPEALAAAAPPAPRPDWQLTRWPVSAEEYANLVEAARMPDPASFDAAVVTDAAAPVAEAPTVDVSFDGLGATGLEPPDPAIAVGPDDVMIAVNADFGLAPKDGSAPVVRRPLSALFSSVLPPGATSLFDPKLAFDHFAQRWIVLVGARRGSPAGSWLMLAASQTADPRGAYHTWALDASLDGATPTNNWADYPALGFDEQAIYVAMNMFVIGGGFVYTKLRILNKREVYAPGPATPSLRWFDVTRLTNPDGRPVFTLQPAVHFRTAPGDAFLANALWASGGTLTVWTLRNPLAAWGNPPATPTLTSAGALCQFYDLPPSAEQQGGPPRLATDDTRLLNAVYHGDGEARGLWVTHTSKFTWPGEPEARSVAQWYQIDPGPPHVVQQGRYGAPGAYHFFPAVQTAANSDAFVVFTRSSATDFAQLRATGRDHGDPPNTLRNSAVVQAGSSTYRNTRWGDYFGVARDPADDGTAWLYGEYAGAAGSWATQVCSVHF
jgi:hypothetical protein